jgi:hypothetical protein
LNSKNEAENRVYEILEQKFHLFSGVFGASDEVLGVLESGVDFERKILEIYQQCRTSEEIASAFEKLQTELDEKIQIRMSDVRQKLLEHYDADVHERLKINRDNAAKALDRIGKIFWNLTTHILKDRAVFNDTDYTFRLKKPPQNNILKGVYRLISKDSTKSRNEFLYRLNHPLGEYVIDEGKNQRCADAEVVFDISNHPVKISMVEQLKSKQGWLRLDCLTVNSLEVEEYLLFSAIDKDGNNLDQELCTKLFQCGGVVGNSISVPAYIEEQLEADSERYVEATLTRNLEENNIHFSEARDQLEKWANDMEKSVEQELDNIKKQIQEKQRLARQCPTLKEQKGIQDEIVKLEKKKRQMREKLFDTEDQIAEKRDKLIDALARRLKQKTTVKKLFTIEWKVI